MDNILYTDGAQLTKSSYWPGSAQLTPSAISETTVEPGPPLYDFSGLGKLAKNAGFVREMQQLFVQRVPGQLAELRRLIEAEDWLALVQEAHGLKATFGILKMEPGATLLGQMEALASQMGSQPQQAQQALLELVTGTAVMVVAIFEQELTRTV